MIRHLKEVRKIAREISDAADGALDAYRENRVVEEPQLTDRILGAIEFYVKNRLFGADSEDRLMEASRASDIVPCEAEDGIVRQPRGGIVWEARTLRTGRGIAAEEKRHGADLMGILDLNLSGYCAKKGFLAQAKRAEPGRQFSNSDWNRLSLQCETMLLRTPASFVWIYSKSRGIRIFSANSVLGLESRDIFDLYSRSVSIFFENHIECFVGDRRLNSTDVQTLDALAELPIERILELTARQSE